MTQQKPEWTKIGTVEVCVGTDGVTGVYINEREGIIRVHRDGTTMYSLVSKADFESKHCQPPKPLHIIREYADGSCVVESVEKDEQGRPLRCAIVRTNVGPRVRWRATWSGSSDWLYEPQDAIARAVRYVETGE